MIVYYTYLVLFIVFLIIRFNDDIYILYKDLKKPFKKAIKNPRITRDISLAIFVNGIFSIINSTSFIGFLAYVMLTLISLVGIIMSNNKIND